MVSLFQEKYILDYADDRDYADSADNDLHVPANLTYLPDLPTFITIGIAQFRNSCDFYEYLNMNIVDDDVACPKISAATPAVQRSFSLPCQLKWWSGSGDNDNN